MFNEQVNVNREYKDRLGGIESLEFSRPNGYWQRLSDYYSKMSADQQNFVSNNKKVLKYKAKMMEAFSLFIFEKYKNDFVQLDSFRKLCDDYVEAVITSSQSYSEQIANTAEENKVLKAKVAELERKLNETKSNTN